MAFFSPLLIPVHLSHLKTFGRGMGRRWPPLFEVVVIRHRRIQTAGEACSKMKESSYRTLSADTVLATESTVSKHKSLDHYSYTVHTTVSQINTCILRCSMANGQLQWVSDATQKINTLSLTGACLWEDIQSSPHTPQIIPYISSLALFSIQV